MKRWHEILSSGPQTAPKKDREGFDQGQTASRIQRQAGKMNFWGTKQMIRKSTLAIAILAAAGCAPAPPAPPAAVKQETAAQPPAPAAVQQPPIKLPISVNEIMVALVDHASEPLWQDAYEPPKSEDHWLEAQYEAYQVAIAGKLIQLMGTGPNDEDWASEADWRAKADEMTAAGMDALRAAKAKSVPGINAAGDRLVASCESCHKKYKPNLTSMGIYKSPNYPPKQKP